jgi:hypothetical protein
MKPVVLARALICAGFVLAAAQSEARFLQVDPVGYKDQANLYAYVGDDPLNHADPSGMDAILLVQDPTHVQIVLPVNFAGDAANAKNIAAFTSDVERRWTGTFDGITVKTTVVQGSSSYAPSVQNSVNLMNGNTSRTGVPGEGHSFVNSNPPGAQITMKDVHGTPIAQSRGDPSISDKGGDTYAHEGGHLMGAPDRAAADGTLMGAGSVTRVTGADVQSMMQQPFTPNNMRNVVIQCSAEPKRC